MAYSNDLRDDLREIDRHLTGKLTRAQRDSLLDARRRTERAIDAMEQDTLVCPECEMGPRQCECEAVELEDFRPLGELVE